MGNKNKGQADNITKYYDYVSQECKPGDLIFVRRMKKIDNYGKVNSSFVNEILNSLSLNHGEGQTDDKFVDFGHMGIVIEGMLGEGGPPFLLEASDYGIICNDLQQRLLYYMREFDQDVHCIAVRSPQADVEISPERKVALADLLSNCLDLEYKQVLDQQLMFELFLRTKDIVESAESTGIYIKRIVESIEKQPNYDNSGTVAPTMLRDVIRNFTVREVRAEKLEKLRELVQMQGCCYISEDNIKFEDIEVVLKELNLIVESELFVYDFDSVLAAQFCKKILQFLGVNITGANIKDTKDFLFEEMDQFQAFEYIASA